MTKNIYIKRVLQVLFIILILWLLYSVGKDWVRPRIIKALGGYTAREYKETIDTLEIKYDSIYFKYKDIQANAYINEPKIITEYRYLPHSSITGNNTQTNQTNNIIPSVVYDKAYEYNNTISDSLLDANIRTVLNPDGCKIIEQTLNYTPKFPKLVTKTITIEKTKTETLFDKPKAKFGVGITGNTKENIGVLGVYQTPKDWQYQVGYTKNIKTDNIFNEPTNGAITVSIIKLF